MSTLSRRSWCAGALAVWLSASVVWASDTADFGGPQRDNQFTETGLLKQWPKNGPALAWEASDLGAGYSSVAVVGDTVYVTGMKKNQGLLHAYSTDGKKKWRVNYGREWSAKQYTGTRSTPTIADGRIYLMTGYGEVVCLDAKSGKKHWAVDTVKKFGGRILHFGFAESPLVQGNNLICTPGGKGATVVALNKKTGETVWQTAGLNDKSAFASPRLVTVNDTQIIVTMIEKSVLGLSLSGKVLWQEPHKNRYSVHPNYPLYHAKSGMLYFSSGYGYGGGTTKLSENGSKATKQWFTKDLDCHHGGVVLVGDYVYGTKFKGSEWLCLDIKTGDIQYSTRSPIGKGAIIYADGMLYGYGENGVVGLVEANPKAHTVVSSFKITKGKGQHWAHPVIEEGKLYIRHGEALMVYNIKK